MSCAFSKLSWQTSIRYGLVVRIPGSHPGGPGSIPGVGNPFWTPGIEYIFGNVKMVFFFLLGAARSRKNIASAGNRTRINCLEGSYADHYTTDASGGQIWHLRDTSCKCMKLVLDVSDYLKVAVSNIYFQHVL